MTSLLLPRRDLEFLLYEWLRVESLTKWPRFVEHSRETFDAAIDTCERIALDLFAPHYKKNDISEPHFDGHKVHLNPEIKKATDAFCEAGLMAATQHADLGGMSLPVVVERAAFAYFMAANCSTSAYPLLAIGNANTILTHGTPAQIETFAKPILEGRYFGTMCLSEPQAGSSLSDITTRAEYEGESPFGPQYRLTGRKMWISAGDHELTENIVHLVLAKVPDASGQLIVGTRGISLFAVPKHLVNPDGTLGERNDVVLAGLNHKMGFRGTTNCLLNFGEGTEFRPAGRQGAIGYRIGDLHGGLKCMFHMMNEARIGVGMGATMLGYTGYRHALEYARGRTQGRAIDVSRKNTQQRQIPIIEHADVKRMLLAQKAYVEGALALTLYCAKLVDEERHSPSPENRANAGLLLEVLTPIAKSWPSQWCLAANDLAIQVHGGYGYTRDYKVEQFYRDNRLNPIHEGTHGIQALDLLGRKVIMKQGQALRLLMSRVEQTVTRASTESQLTNWAGTLHDAILKLGSVTMKLWAFADPEIALRNATVYLEAFGHVVLAWLWLEQALVALPHSSDFHAGKLAACRYFFEWELPKVEPQLNLLASANSLLTDMQDQWF